MNNLDEVFELLHDVLNKRLEAYAELPISERLDVKTVFECFARIRHGVRLTSFNETNCSVLFDHFRNCEDFIDILNDVTSRFYARYVGYRTLEIEELENPWSKLITLLAESLSIMQKADNKAVDAYRINADPYTDGGSLTKEEWSMMFLANPWLVTTVLLNFSDYTLDVETTKRAST